MKGYSAKSLMALGAMMMVCSCGDDSNDGSAVSPNPQGNCAAYTVFSAGWIQDFGDGTYWVLDQASAAAGNGVVFDASGNPVAGAYFVIDGEVGTVFDSEGPYVTLNMPTQLLCPANATKTETGEIIKSSSSVVANSSAADDVPANSSASNESAGSEVPASQAGQSSAGTQVSSSAAVILSSGSADTLASSANEPVIESSSSEPSKIMGEFKDIADYGEPPAEYTKDILSNGKTGWSSRYWDACKPHCSWLSSVDTTSEETYQAGMTVARNCNIHDVEVPAFTLGHAVQKYWMGYEGTNSACVNNNAGGTYTCTDMAPIEVNENLSYGYVAAPGDQFGGGCGKCFHLQFNGGNHANDVKDTHKALKGKHMIVMASNIGYDVEPGQYDMLVPGGGVGAFNALSNQIGVPASDLGANGGGFLTECQQSLGWDNTIEKYQECVIAKCESVFKDWPNLLRGCKWYAEWYMAADNPTYNWEEVECPQYLIDHYMTNFNTTKENRWKWHDDWSSYKAGDELETQECWKDGENPNDPNGKGAGCKN
ncbi:MAG: glycosyl hydrolase family 5 [Fibrobacter sp.]|nr:glycosyl hydrolase family 5 [Fibrobacter sp.]